MTISTDPALETVILLKQHRPFSLGLTLLKQDGSRVDLTGASLRLVIADLKRKGGTVRVTSNATLVSAVDGTSRFDVQADDLGFTPGVYDMAITLTSAEGFASTIIEGQVELTYNADPTVPADHGGVVAPLSLSATLRDQNRITVRVNHHPDSVLLDAVAQAELAVADAAQWGQGAALHAGTALEALNQTNSALESARSARDFAELYRDAAAVSAGAAATSATEADASAAAADADAAAAAASAAAAAASATTATNQATAASASASDAADWSASAAIHVENAQTHSNAAQAAATDAEASATAAAASAASIVEGDYVESTTVDHIEVLTQAAYDALDPKVATTFYVIVD